MKTQLRPIILLFILFQVFQFNLFPQLKDTISRTDTIRKNDTLSFKNNSINVFIDCNYCDESNLREEITFINYVRDRKVADVHILAALEPTGSGGNNLSFYFIGLRKFAHLKDTLTFALPPDATAEDWRQTERQMIKMGLMRYIAKTPLSKYFSIVFNNQEGNKNVEDKWKNWVFNIRMNSYLYGEESSRNSNFYTSMSASKITDKWKISLNLFNSTSNQTYRYDTESISSSNRSNAIDQYIVMSLGDHWSTGYLVELGNSTYRNLKMGFTFSPGIEYDFFPYSKSTRKLLTLSYQFAYQHFNYMDTTLYLKTKENLLMQAMTLSFKTKQQWGSISMYLSGSNYLHDLSKNSLNIYGNVDIRIFKGLSLSLYASAGLIHDQLTLPKAGATLAEVLLHQQQLATQFSYSGMIGFTYSFGSIYNNIVNPRFDNTGMRNTVWF